MVFTFSTKSEVGEQQTVAMCRSLLLLAYAILAWRTSCGKLGLATWPSLLHRSNCSIRSPRYWTRYLRWSGIGTHFLWLLIPRLPKVALADYPSMRLRRLFLKHFHARSLTQMTREIDLVGQKNPLASPVTSSSRNCF